MAKGDSGRIVLEIDPELKKDLYAVLAMEQQTLKEWFILRAESHICEKKAELMKSFLKAEDEV
ncbi:hypothetical protein [Acinetobacter beijerinckii]|uniref:Uncharacterized protein n=1 Tax=Acinetobacter beijerinckii ANC 3835 TaxID=1217649 RepID=N9FM71_9GAMM|nr:hypothetical protein [Acinetobacter beijerinckii]ENW05939.1 hypothetical protein F934_00795 [Acinetobacter beijerinckii ANC 3835]